jgi:hypothetical protein
MPADQKLRSARERSNVPGEELLRNLYPDILTLTPGGVNSMAGRDRLTRAFLLGICEDLQWVKARPGQVGWVARANPFLRMDLAGHRVHRIGSSAGRGSPLAVRAGAWFGIGAWVLAERYYKRAVRQGICRDEVAATLQHGVRLGLVYLGAGNTRAAERLARHLIEATGRASGGLRDALELQALAILCLALISAGRHAEAERESGRLRALAGGRAGRDGPEAAVYQPLADTLWSTGRAAERERWQELWWDFEQLLDGPG